MSDIADVMDALQAISTEACFPNGTAQPTITGRVVAIGQGFPIAKDIDDAIANGVTLVSIYAIPGTTARSDHSVRLDPRYGCRPGSRYLRHPDRRWFCPRRCPERGPNTSPLS